MNGVDSEAAEARIEELLRYGEVVGARVDAALDQLAAVNAELTELLEKIRSG